MRMMKWRRSRKDGAAPDAHEKSLQQDRDRYGVRLIKVVGVVGAALGLAIIIAFWYWVMRMLYSI